MNLKKDDIIYVLCPDKECKLFYSDVIPLPCHKNRYADVQCPHLDKTKFLLFCLACGEPIILDSDFSGWQRIDHICCTMILSRQCASAYRLVYINEPPCEDPSKEADSPNPFNRGITLKIKSLLRI